MSFKFKTLLIVFASLMLVAAPGCSRKEQNPAEKTSLDIKGSDTMVNLMSNMAESYMAAHQGINIAVTGGGSGTGIAALLNGTTDICASSRSLGQKEIDLANSKNINPTELIIGMDGLAVMVNKNGPVDSLTLDQLRQIYIGEITNWSVLGGPDQEITLLSRESNSGTHVYFKEHVLNKSDFASRALLMPSTATIAQEVMNNTYAIGYGGVAYALNSDVKIVAIKKDADAPSVLPTDEAVSNGIYPIARPLFLYVNGSPQGLIQQFIDFCLTPEGQKIVLNTGYVPIK
jgi:phosphate transport system substrate-binding protein